MEKIRSSVLLGAVAVSISAILWGFDGIVLTPRLFNLDVAFVVFILHLFPFILMNIFLFRQYRFLKKFTLTDYYVLILIAILGGALGTLSIVKALFILEFKKLTIVVLLQKLQPVFAIALAAFFLKERLARNYIIWAVIAILSGYFLTFGFHPPNLGTGAKTVYAALFALLAAFSFGSSTVLSKKILNTQSFYTATFYRYGFTTLIMFIVVVVMSKLPQFKEITVNNFMVFILIGLTTGSGAIFLYYYGLNKVRAIIATICELFFPISAILFDYLFNNQKLSYIQWIAAAVMIFAIVNLNISNRKPQVINAL